MTATQATAQTPEWVKDAIFYQIFPDRFARSGRLPPWIRLEPWDAPPTREGFKGGDLWGVLARLDYLQDLGITALYFNPIFQSAANHRYHTHDYHQVDPLLGGNEAFRALLDAAHRRGIRIVLDGVFNHASRGFFPFHHILENGPASPYGEPLFLGVEHVGLYATPDTSVDALAAWYGERFGFRATATPSGTQFLALTPQGGRIEVLPPSGSVRCHVAVRVADFDAAVEALRAKGVELEAPIVLPSMKLQYLKEPDPAGNRVHIVWKA